MFGTCFYLHNNFSERSAHTRWLANSFPFFCVSVFHGVMCLVWHFNAFYAWKLARDVTLVLLSLTLWLYVIPFLRNWLYLPVLLVWSAMMNRYSVYSKVSIENLPSQTKITLEMTQNVSASSAISLSLSLSHLASLCPCFSFLTFILIWRSHFLCSFHSVPRFFLYFSLNRFNWIHLCKSFFSTNVKLDTESRTILQIEEEKNNNSTKQQNAWWCGVNGSNNWNRNLFIYIYMIIVYSDGFIECFWWRPIGIPNPHHPNKNKSETESTTVIRLMPRMFICLVRLRW